MFIDKAPSRVRKEALNAVLGATRWVSVPP
jgi:hypothetical protein